jgi:hypothetical protein
MEKISTTKSVDGDIRVFRSLDMFMVSAVRELFPANIINRIGSVLLLIYQNIKRMRVKQIRGFPFIFEGALLCNIL